MKFTILQQDLLPLLQSVSRSVGVRSTLPVLDNLLLAVENKNLKVSATNLEIGVIEFIAIEDGVNGEITVPAKILVELVGGLGPSKITLETNGEILSVQSGKFKGSINGISASEFPAIPQAQGAGISLPKEAFLGASQILFASAVDEGRPVLTGILTGVCGNKLDFVATDGFRLAHRQVSLAKESDQFKTLIPKRTFEEVLRITGEQEIEQIKVNFAQDQNQAVFTLGKSIVSSRLIEGQFPAWEKIIPEKFLSRSFVEKGVLVEALKLASVFAKNEANIVVMTLKKDALKLESHIKELGSQENEIEAGTEGEDLTIAFNTKFLLDAISAAPTTQIMIEFSGSLSAVRIKPVGEEGLEYIVMPVRLS